MALSDLLNRRRPHRPDAARNFDAIIAAAREGFTDSGTEASLEDIARRAGVGPATLYRNFPTRADLIEAAYVAEVDSLCQDALRLAEAEEPWPGPGRLGTAHTRENEVALDGPEPLAPACKSSFRPAQ